MQRYDSYKDSGVKWLGEIPSHWEVCKVKNLCVEIFSGGTPSSGETKYWDGNIPWIPSGMCHDCDIECAPKYITELGYRNSSTRFIPSGTTVMAMTGATCSMVGFLKFESCANQSVTAFVSHKRLLKSRYLFFLLQAMRKYILTFQTGGAQGGINVNDCKNLIIPRIPAEEQEAIANYLDAATSKIDEAISQQQKMIDLLNERKQIIINNAVTKGLDPNVKMKPSGINWIGDIPEHWDIVKTSYIFNHIGSGTTPKSGQEDYYSEDGLYFLQTGDLNNGYVNNTTKRITAKALRDTNLKIYPRGSLVIAMYGATIGKLGMLNIDTTVNQACCVLPETKKMVTKYAFYSLMVAKNDLILQSKGGGQPNISQDTIKNEKLIVPPIIDQSAIVDYVDQICIPIQTAIDAANHQISLLQERKQIIINDVVTGKVKVI